MAELSALPSPRTRVCRCGEEFEVPKTGRPPRFCSVSCRRSAEYELRRVQQLLVRAEKALQDARLAEATEFGTQHTRRREWWEAERERLYDDLEQIFICDEESDLDASGAGATSEPTSQGG